MEWFGSLTFFNESHDSTFADAVVRLNFKSNSHGSSGSATHKQLVVGRFVDRADWLSGDFS